jgi:SAM-dependent methyltransferase
MDSAFDPAQWIEQHINLELCDTVGFIYDHVDSQSGCCLPLIYQPFDAARRGHFTDRASAHDFSQAVGGGRVLDFGPGDGWPSLIIAPYCEEVVGVDGAAKRVEVCTANAARLGIDNARFVHSPPGAPLPFDDGGFDGVVASSSIEQAPDPQATLAELARVLKPGGRLRMDYEALERYRGGQERELWRWRDQPQPRHIILHVRNLSEERARQYRLTVDLSGEEIDALFAARGTEFGYQALTEQLLSELASHVTSGAVCDTIHPSGPTWMRLLTEAGFSSVRATHSGRRFARELFGRLPEAERPLTMADVDAYLRPLVAQVIELDAPGEGDPMLTAVR